MPSIYEEASAESDLNNHKMLQPMSPPIDAALVCVHQQQHTTHQRLVRLACASLLPPCFRRFTSSSGCAHAVKLVLTLRVQ
jgi:hypothetical protein